jgi:hypothetical protein
MSTTPKPAPCPFCGTPCDGDATSEEQEYARLEILHAARRFLAAGPDANLETMLMFVGAVKEYLEAETETVSSATLQAPS